MQSYEITPAGVTDTGAVRVVNEDHLLAEGQVFAVADGMGGHGNGEVASRVAVEALRAAFGPDPTTAGLVDAVKQANAAVRQRSREEAGSSAGYPDGGPSGGPAGSPVPGSGTGPVEGRSMGTTIAAVALVVDDDKPRLTAVNVGDSRVYLLRGGELIRLSSDHSLVADLMRSGRITEEQAGVHPHRHVLTQALGIQDDVEPFVSHTDPEAGDRVLLCSDGLFNELSNEEIAATLQSVDRPEDAATRLVAEANDRGGNDNITAVVLDIT